MDHYSTLPNLLPQLNANVGSFAHPAPQKLGMGGSKKTMARKCLTSIFLHITRRFSRILGPRTLLTQFSRPLTRVSPSIRRCRPTRLRDKSAGIEGQSGGLTPSTEPRVKMGAETKTCYATRSAGDRNTQSLRDYTRRASKTFGLEPYRRAGRLERGLAAWSRTYDRPDGDVAEA